MIDTYWSDHCRHTTFGTEIDRRGTSMTPRVQAAFDQYMDMRNELGRQAKPVCLMDMGTIGAKWLKSKGVLTGLDESEEINACTVKVQGRRRRRGAGLAVPVQERNAQPSHGDRAVRRRGNLHGRRHPRPACRAAATCTRPCASPVRQIRLHPCPRRCPASCRSASWSPRPLPAIPATATRSAWQPARSTSCITPATWPSAWRSAPLWAQRPPTMCAARRPRRATWWCCWAAAPAVTASAAPRASPRRTTSESHGDTAAPRCRRAIAPDGAQDPAPVPPRRGHAPHQALQRLRRGRRVRCHRRAGRRPATST